MIWKKQTEGENRGTPYAVVTVNFPLVEAGLCLLRPNFCYCSILLGSRSGDSWPLSQHSFWQVVLVRLLKILYCAHGICVCPHPILLLLQS